MIGRRALRLAGGRLALLALWLQLALSFGHMHPDDVFGPLGHPVVRGHAIAVVAADPHRVPFAPVQPGPGEVGPDNCAICASMALVAASALPEPARLPVPAAATAPPIVAARRFVASAPPFRLFHTRAPPPA